MSVQEGKKAPNFKLPAADGSEVSLKDFQGKNVVLYFYPKDMTPGCTQEACDFRDGFKDFTKANAVIIGMSPDSPSSHQKFIANQKLPFILVSDEDKEVLKSYGVWKEKSMYGRKYMGVERTTLLIDKLGKIRKIYPKVKVKEHAKEVFKDLRDL